MERPEARAASNGSDDVRRMTATCAAVLGLELLVLLALWAVGRHFGPA